MAKQHTYVWTSAASSDPIESPVFQFGPYNRLLHQVQLFGDSGIWTTYQNNVSLPDGSPNPDAWFALDSGTSITGGSFVNNFLQYQLYSCKFFKFIFTPNSGPSSLIWTGTLQELETYPAR